MPFRTFQVMGESPGSRAIRAVAILALILTAASAFGQSSLFVETEGFATKTGFRGVFIWKATQPVAGVVHYGKSPSALDSTVQAIPGAPDTAQIAVASDLEIGAVYYWQVEDTLTGERSAIRQLTASNAYTSWNGELYTIDMLLQLDLDGLPEDVPHDLALQEIANGMNIFSERLYDALDGHARLGKLIVTDTNLDYAANQPFGDPFGGLVCDGENATVADVIVQTTIPFDSHTWGGWSIEKPCIGFYVGRIGQLVLPWEDELHFGYVSTHELMHYAFNAPDLYTVEGPVTTDCRNPDWDGSVMHNTGGWIGRWDLTELDRNPTLTPCFHGPEPYTWDALRVRYTEVPLAPDGPILDMFNYEAKGNPDGDGLEVWILDREPGSSTLTRYFPSDDIPACDFTSSPVVDAMGDGSTIHTVDPGLVSDTNLDIVEGAIRWNGATETTAFTVRVADLTDTFFGAVEQTYRWYFDYEGSRYQVRTDRDVLNNVVHTLRDEAGVVLATIGGSIDIANDTITMELGKNTIPGAPSLVPGQRLTGFELYARRDFATDATGGVSLITDTARGSCSYIVNQENWAGNAAPVAAADEATTIEDMNVDIDVLANDFDPNGDAIHVHSVTASSGSASLNADGTVRFTPPSNQSGVELLTYVIRDSRGASAQGTVTVTIEGIQDAPVAVADVALASSGTPVDIDVLANDHDPDGDALTITSVTQPTFGSASIAGGTITYFPGGGFATEDSFSYTISDGNGGTGRATVTVIRTCLGAFADDFEPVPEEGWTFSNENLGLEGLGTTITTWQHTSDPISSSPDHSFFSDASDLSANKDDRLIAPPMDVTSLTKLSFWHRYSTEITFDGGVLEVSTDEGATWSDVVAAGGIFEKGGYVGPANALGGRDAWHGQSPQFPLMNEVVVDLGALAGQTVLVRWRLKTDTNLGDLGWWVDDVRFRDIAITDCGPAANRAPDAVDDSATVAAGSSVTIAVLANDNDPDGDSLFVSSVTSPSNGSASTDGTTVVYTPDQGFSGTDHFHYSISDGFGGSDLAMVTVNVNAPPTATADEVSTHEDQAITISVLANDSDPDGDSLSIVSASPASHGSVAVLGDGISYTPAPNYNGSDGFTYTVSDGRGGEATGTVSVTIIAVNDAPVASDDSAVCHKNRSVDIDVLSNDKDVDGDPIRIIGVGRAEFGSVTITNDGLIRYRAKKGFTGTDSFEYAITDDHGGYHYATVSVNVTD